MDDGSMDGCGKRITVACAVLVLIVCSHMFMGRRFPLIPKCHWQSPGAEKLPGCCQGVSRHCRRAGATAGTGWEFRCGEIWRNGFSQGHHHRLSCDHPSRCISPHIQSFGGLSHSL